MVKSKNRDSSLNSREIKSRSAFFTLKARLAFTQLRQVFIKTPIFDHFDPKYHIQIEIDVFKYAIDGILNPLTLDNLS